MPDQTQQQTVICQGGLDNSENHLALSDGKEGVAARLVNYEVGEFGGYRRIEGFDYLNPAGNTNTAETNSTVPGTGSILGVFVYRDLYDLADDVIAIRQVSGQSYYSIYKMRSSNTWLNISDGGKLNNEASQNYRPTATGVDRVHITKFNDDEGNKVCITDGVNPAVIYWNTTGGHNFQQIVSTGNKNSTNTSASPPTGSSGSNDGYGGDQAINQPKCSAFYKTSLYLGGDGSNDQPASVVAYSAATDIYDFSASGGAAQIPVDVDVVNMMPFRDDLYIFGRTGIKRIKQSGTDIIAENVTRNLGCVAPDSVVEIGGDLIFLAQDGFRPVAGTARIGDIELETLSKSIQSDLIHLSSTYDLDRMVSVVIPSKAQVRYFLNAATPTDISVADAPGFIGGLRTEDNTTGWEWGRIQGIQANCTDSGYIGNIEYIVHGDHTGKIYQQEIGNDFNGADITAIYETPYIDMGDPLVRKTIRKVDAFIRAEGTMTMGLTLDFDYGDPDLFRPADLSSITEGAISEFGRAGVTYVDDADDPSIFLYGGQTKPVLSYQISGSGHSVQFRFISSGTFAPYSIQGLILKFTTSGKQ